MDTINFNTLTNVERILLTEDFDYYLKKYNSNIPKIRNELNKLLKGKELSVLERVDYRISFSYDCDIYFREEYLKIFSIKRFYKFLGYKIYYKNIVGLDYNHNKKECTIKYFNKGRIYGLKFSAYPECYKLLSNLYKHIVC
jgi:hypothetical protein